MARNVRSRVTLFNWRIKQLTDAQKRALEQTAEALHTEVIRAQVMPRDTGTLQDEKTFVDKTNAKNGKVLIVTEGPYARRLYYHPEYRFNTEGWDERVYGKRGQYKKKGGQYKGKIIHHEGNANARGKWYAPWLPGGEKENFAKETFARAYQREMRRSQGGENQ